MMKILVDSTAWVEYIEGSELGEKLRSFILGNDELYVISLIIGEVISKAGRKKMDVEVAYKSIVSNSSVINLTPKMAREAGLLHAEMRIKSKNFGLADAMILTAARSIGAKLLTKDDHFKGFKETMFIK